MSNEALNWALSQSIKSPLKPVLIALANRADNTNFEAFPSVEVIAFDIGVSESTVTRATRELVRLGLISKANKKSYGHRYMHNVYTLHLDVNLPAGSEMVSAWRAPSSNMIGADEHNDVLNISESSKNHQDINKAHTRVHNKKGKISKNIKTSLPEGFGLSEQIITWGEQHGYSEAFLQLHLDHFKDVAAAKGYQYVDWDAAFRNAVKGDWAKLSVPMNKPPSAQSKTSFNFVTKHDAVVDKNRIAKEQFLAMKRREAMENGIRDIG